jgi:hypothetical protein
MTWLAIGGWLSAWTRSPQAIRALRIAKLGAIKTKTAATNTLRAMIITASEPLRA